MDHLKQKQKQIEKMMDVLKRSKVSTGEFDSTMQPFFKPDVGKVDFEINHDNDFEVPDGLNRNVKLIYDILGDSKKEIYIGEWTIMSLEKSWNSMNIIVRMVRREFLRLVSDTWEWDILN